VREAGKIVRTFGDRAEVEVAAKGACEHCGAHSVCNWTGTRVRRVLARNRAQAGAGDTVELETAGGILARSNLLVFGIPATGMLGGVLVGGLGMRSDLWSGVLSGIGLALGLGIVRAIDLYVRRSGRGLPVVVGRTVQDEGEANESDVDGDVDHGPGDGVRR